MKHNYYTLKQRAREMRNNPTDAERILWYRLRNRRLYRYPFLRQRIIDGMLVDFVCRKTKLVIEVDGGQHDQRKPADTARTERLNRAGYQVLRFWNNDVIFNTESVLHTIDQTLKEQETQQPSQPPRRQHKTKNTPTEDSTAASPPPRKAQGDASKRSEIAGDVLERTGTMVSPARGGNVRRTKGARGGGVIAAGMTETTTIKLRH